MKFQYKWTILSLVFAFLFACGGGGGGSDPGGSEVPLPTRNNVISGIAAKGLIINGTVKVFALSASGQKGDLLATVSTDARGRYAADVGDYTGAVLVEASGPYIDEATGQEAAVPEDAPLRAALTGVGGDVSVAVTPFTDLAVRRAEGAGGLDAVRVQEANTLVSDLLRFDILTTLPVSPTAEELAGADEAQKTSTLTLAALCQLASDRREEMPQLLIELADEVAATGGLTHATLDQLARATDTFLAGDRNRTGITDPSTTVLPNIGRTPVRLRLQLQGTADGAALGGVELRLILPEGSRLATDPSGQASAEGVALAPVLAGSYLEVHYLPETPTALAELRLALVSVDGFAPGELAAVEFEVLGSSLPAASAFSLASFTAVDGDGAPLAGVSGAFSVEGR